MPASREAPASRRFEDERSFVNSRVFDAVVYSSRDALLDALHAGESPNILTDGQSALSLACLQDRPDLVKDLLANGADPNILGGDGSTPLFVAAGTGNSEIVRDLLTAGAGSNARNAIGQSPLMISATAGDNASISLLLDAAADARAIDAEGRNALHWAVIGGDFTDVIHSLIDAGASAQDRTKDGLMSLDYAKSLNRLSAEQMLR